MRKKLLILASFTTAISPMFAVSCKEVNDEGKEIKPILPSYNIANMVKDINKLEFERQFPKENFGNYNCDNSWFSIFEARDRMGLFSENAQVKQTSHEIIHHVTKEIKNDSNRLQEVHFDGFDELIPRQGLNNLRVLKNLVIDQDFSVFGPKLLKGAKFNIANNELIDNSTLAFKIEGRDFELEPQSSLKWSAKIKATFELYQDFLVFNLAKNTTIMNKFTNLLNGEELYMQYSLETLLINVQEDERYQKVLSNEASFLKIDDKSNQIQMQLEARLWIISDYQVIEEWQ